MLQRFKISAILFFFICMSFASSLKAAKPQNSLIKTYNTVSELKSNTDAVVGDTVKTLGYYNMGDGGGARYIICKKANNNINIGCDIVLSNKNLIAKLTPEGNKIFLRQIGAKGDGINDDSVFAQRALDNYNEVVFASGSYLLHNLEVKKNNTIIYFQQSNVKLKYYTNLKNTFYNLFKIKNKSNIVIDGLKIKGQYSIKDSNTKDPTIESIIDCENCDNLTFKNFKISKVYMRNSALEKSQPSKGAIANVVDCKNVEIRDSEFYDINYVEWFTGRPGPRKVNTIIFNNCTFGKNRFGYSATSIFCTNIIFTNNKVKDYKYRGSLFNLHSEKVIAENNYVDNSKLKYDEMFNCVFDTCESGKYSSKDVIIKNNTFIGKSKSFVKSTSDNLEISNNTVNEVERFFVTVSQTERTFNPLIFDSNKIKILNNIVKGGMHIYPEKQPVNNFIQIANPSDKYIKSVEISNNKFELEGNENGFMSITNSEKTLIANNILCCGRLWSSRKKDIMYGCIHQCLSDNAPPKSEIMINNNYFLFPKNKPYKINEIKYYNLVLKNRNLSKDSIQKKISNNTIEHSKFSNSNLEYFDAKSNKFITLE